MASSHLLAVIADEAWYRAELWLGDFIFAGLKFRDVMSKTAQLTTVNFTRRYSNWV